jgi:hypothetical protein
MRVALEDGRARWPLGTREWGGGPEAVTPVIAGVCDLTPYSLVFRFRRFGGTRSLCLQGSSIFKPGDAFRTSGRLIIPDCTTQPILYIL